MCRREWAFDALQFGGSGSQIARKDSRFLAFMRVAACDPTEFARFRNGTLLLD